MHDTVDVLTECVDICFIASSNLGCSFYSFHLAAPSLNVQKTFNSRLAVFILIF